MLGKVEALLSPWEIPCLSRLSFQNIETLSGRVHSLRTGASLSGLGFSLLSHRLGRLSHLGH